MSWSRLIDTDFERAARQIYMSDPRRLYHNQDHIDRLFHHAETTFGFAYDACLDAAIIGHDVIYDSGDEKELRSADWVLMQLGADWEPSWTHIMKTARHTITSDNRMVLLDLADLMDPVISLVNQDAIIAETALLYPELSLPEIHARNAAFLTHLAERFSDTQIARAPQNDRPFFRDIRAGIDLLLSVGS